MRDIDTLAYTVAAHMEVEASYAQYVLTKMTGNELKQVIQKFQETGNHILATKAIDLAAAYYV